MRRACAGVVLAVLCVLPAEARPVHSTKYSYYSINGDSAEEIYGAMLRKGPRVNGAKAYAATSATTTQDGRMAQGGSCRIEAYRLTIDFVIRLPKIRNERVLPPADRRHWQQFAAFLKKHEETHRAIWIDCATELERQVKAIHVKSCAEADRRARQLWERMRAACTKKHNAFDAAEQKRLMKHPFVRLVYGRKLASSAAAVVE